jgi:RNA polymerase sigma factor (sigma-70 family)
MSPHASSSALEGLYRSQHRELLDWLCHKIGNSSLAADLAHDTFIRLLIRSEAPQEPGQPLREPKAYLRAIAKGLLVDHWRHQSLETAYQQALALQPECSAPSPEERALLLEALKQLARMLDGLQPRVRSAFLLAQIDGLPYAEIATQLGVSVRSVERYVTQALFQCHLLMRSAAQPATQQP